MDEVNRTMVCNGRNSAIFTLLTVRPDNICPAGKTEVPTARGCECGPNYEQILVIFYPFSVHDKSIGISCNYLLYGVMKSNYYLKMLTCT